MLEEVGVPYRFEVVNLETQDQKKPGFLAVNPMGKVPAIVHRGLGALGLQLVEDLGELGDLLFAQVQLVGEEPERPADPESAGAEVLSRAAPRTRLPARSAFTCVRAFAVSAAVPARVLPPPHHAWVHCFLQLAGAHPLPAGTQAWAPCLTPLD